MRRLILVKHSLPEIVPDLPAAHWRLGDEGRRRCEALADRLTAFEPAVVATSTEPKAAETAAIVAGRLSLPVVTAAGLHEHDRGNVGVLSETEFRASVARFFAHPDDLVFGRETAAQARERFSAAVAGIVAAHPTGNPAIVAHGTVVAPFVAAASGADPWQPWRRLGLPSIVVLSLPELQVLSVVEAIAMPTAPP